MALTVVIGPPAAGKSTWVRDHAAVGVQPEDILVVVRSHH